MVKLIKAIIKFLKGLFSKTTLKKEIKKDQIILTNKEKRDAFLHSKGYTVPRKTISAKDKPILISHHRACVLAYSKAKILKKIKIYDDGIGGFIRNKYGIPFYELLK